MKTVVLISFYADRMPGGADAFLSATQCGPDVAEVKKFGDGVECTVTVKVTLTLDEADERIAKVRALLAQYGEEEFSNRRDVYTEGELQNAPLLQLVGTFDNIIGTGPHHGTTYDISNACKKCGTGVRQTSPLVIDKDDERRIAKRRVSIPTRGDLLIHDVDGEKFVNAKLTGFNLWPIYSSRNDGTKVELLHEQVFVENVMPPMAPSSLIDRREVCPVCQRGRFNVPTDDPLRIVYRREDLKNIQDFNVTWECFGSSAKTLEEALTGNWPDPLVLVTPKVMNLLRGKTKKEKKYEGVSFTPIWIEGETS